MSNCQDELAETLKHLRQIFAGHQTDGLQLNGAALGQIDNLLKQSIDLAALQHKELHENRRILTQITYGSGDGRAMQ